MNYEQKYKDALERAKEICVAFPLSKSTRNTCETIFPELRESEDERIRKAIIELIKQSSEVLNKQNQKQMLAWLEKQGEKKPTDEEMKELLRTEYEKGRADTIAETQVAWSEEDDIMKQNCHQMLALLRPNSSELIKDTIDNCHHWLKSLKDKVQPQSQLVEWTPYDDGMLSYIIDDEYCPLDIELQNWLKDLKQRITNKQ